MKLLMKPTFLVAIAMAFSLSMLVLLDISAPQSTYKQAPTSISSKEHDYIHVRRDRSALSSKRKGRFLASIADEGDSGGADVHNRGINLTQSGLQCLVDYEICVLSENPFRLPSNLLTCCDKKCYNLQNDINHCGTCNKKCTPPQLCCRGRCVNCNSDRNNCGSCSKECGLGLFCELGICGYA